jgi:hypothetical protein
MTGDFLQVPNEDGVMGRVRLALDEIAITRFQGFQGFQGCHRF